MLLFFSLLISPVPAADESGSDQVPKTSIIKDNSSLQRRIWTSPFKMSWGKAAIWGGLALTTAILIKHDEAIFSAFQSYRNRNRWVYDFSPIITESGGIMAFGIGGLFCLSGWLSQNTYTLQTGSLALQAMIHSGFVSQVLKIVTGRRRPHAAAGQDWWSGPPFMSNPPPDDIISGMNSFPSGHSTTVWSLATVISGRYPKFWVGALSYSIATLGALSRVVEEKHWLSDTLIGAAIGYGIGRLVLRNHRRKLQFSPVINGREWSLSAHLILD